MRIVECGGELAEQLMAIKGCGPALGCLPEFLDSLTVGIGKCIPQFYKLCDFERLIRICPFDPAWEAFEWKQKMVSERLEALEVEVKELQAQLPAGR
jgi:hypothetical protein